MALLEGLSKGVLIFVKTQAAATTRHFMLKANCQIGNAGYTRQVLDRLKSPQQMDCVVAG